MAGESGSFWQLERSIGFVLWTISLPGPWWLPVTALLTLGCSPAGTTSSANLRIERGQVSVTRRRFRIQPAACGCSSRAGRS